MPRCVMIFPRKANIPPEVLGGCTRGDAEARSMGRCDTAKAMPSVICARVHSGQAGFGRKTVDGCNWRSIPAAAV